MRLAKKGMMVSAVFGVNAVVQLVNQIVITRVFGASEGLEVFLAAVAVPAVLVSGVYATLNDAFLPIYGRLKKQKGEAERFLRESLGGLLLVGIMMGGVLAGAAGKISWWLYGERGWEFVEKVAREMRILVWGIPVAVMVVVLGSVWYARKRFIRFPVAQMVGNVVILLGVVGLGRTWGEQSLVILFLVSLLVQGLIMRGEFRGLGFSWQKTKQVVEAWVPMIVSFVIFRSEGVVVRYFASKLEAGYLVYLNLASKLMIMAVGVVTVGVQILLLPHLVESLSDKKQVKRGVKLVNKAKMVSTGMALLTGVGVMVVLPWVLDMFFVGGRFNPDDVVRVKMLLRWFLLPAIGLGIYPVFMQPIIALNRQKTVAGIAIVAGMVAWMVAMWGSWVNVGVVKTMSLTLFSLVFTGIILSEIIWQKEKAKLLA